MIIIPHCWKRRLVPAGGEPPIRAGLDYFDGRNFGSALSLLMFGVLANYHYFAFALNDLAFFAHRLYGRTYFHFFTSYFVLQVIRPRVKS